MSEPGIREPIFAFWCRYPSARNFGDALTPWLIWKITGTYPIFSWPEDDVLKYLAVGSIIEYANPTTVVWGAGVLARHDEIDPGTRICAVRGPITRQRALECGATCPSVYGDPALLLPRFYAPRPSVSRALVGVVPHYFDKPKLLAFWHPPPYCKIIDIQQRVEVVIDQIASCDYILSSSLHGLIVAHAYGVPAAWVRFNKSLLGDGTKFHDYLEAVEQSVDDAITLDMQSFDPESLLQSVPMPPAKFDTAPLWDACPFRSRA
jgi:pyruvyltransferase